MATYERDGASIYYEEYGAGEAILLIAPGGMRSAISFWENTPWNPIEQLREQYRVVAMDQRNAGQSAAPVRAEDSWHTYTADQLGLMDHLGIDRFHVAGMCIGGPYSLGLIEAAPQRVASATLFQTIGRDANRDAFYAMFDDWAVNLRRQMPEVEEATWLSFRENMYGGDKVLFNVDTDFVAKCKTPLLVLMGDDLYHPQSSSRLVADVAPDVEFIEYWKEGEDRNAAMDAFAGFLARNAI